MRLFLYILFILALASNSFAQTDSTFVRVGIRMLDAENNQPIFNAQSISYTSQHNFVTDEDGVLIYDFLIGDSLKIFGLGYEAKVIKVADFTSQDSIIDIKLGRRTYMIQAVDVGTNKLHLHLPDGITLGKNEDLPPAPLRNDSYRSKPPIYAAVLSPASFIHYHTSKKEKQKRAFRAELVEYNNQLVVDEFYNKEIIKEVSGYEQDSLNKFIVYCNTHLSISAKTNPFLVKQMILDAKTEFEKL